MNTTTPDPIPADLMAALQEAAELAARGVRDPDQLREACAEMDRIREDVRARHGILDIGVPAIRELRGDLDSLP